MPVKVGVDTVLGTNILDVAVPAILRERVRSGIDFFDEILGGETGNGRGLTPSQVTLFCGSPGAGKTTLMMMVADGLTAEGHIAYYNSAEESKYQLKIVAERLDLDYGFVVGQRMSTPEMLEDCDRLRARFPNKHLVLIADSLQTLEDGRFSTGRITCRTAEENMTQIANYTKEHCITSLVIGHVTKDGKMAGVNTLRHMVDTFMTLSTLEKTKDKELQEFVGCRLLETTKNRWGGIARPSILSMGERGLSLKMRLE